MQRELVLPPTVEAKRMMLRRCRLVIIEYDGCGHVVVDVANAYAVESVVDVVSVVLCRSCHSGAAM